MEYKDMLRNAWAFEDAGFKLCTLRDVAEIWQDKRISIENDDYRGCPAVDYETLKRLYRGTDILESKVINIQLSTDGTIKCWL